MNTSVLITDDEDLLEPIRFDAGQDRALTEDVSNLFRKYESPPLESVRRRMNKDGIFVLTGGGPKDAGRVLYNMDLLHRLEDRGSGCAGMEDSYLLKNPEQLHKVHVVCAANPEGQITAFTALNTWVGRPKWSLFACYLLPAFRTTPWTRGFHPDYLGTIRQYLHKRYDYDAWPIALERLNAPYYAVE